MDVIFCCMIKSLQRKNRRQIQLNTMVLRGIAMFLVTSPIVINVPTRGLLAVETMHAIVQWLANLI